MAETGTQQTDTVLPEYQEKYLKDLLATAQAVAGAGQEIPKYEDFVAALTPAQLKAIEIGTQGIGAYQPMLEEGAQTLASGVTTLGEGADLTRLGAEQVTGATGAYEGFSLMSPGGILTAASLAGLAEKKEPPQGQMFEKGERLPDYEGRIIAKPYYSPITNQRYMTLEEKEAAEQGVGIMSAAAGGYIEGPAGS